MTEKIFHLGIKALVQEQSGKFLVLKVNQAKFKDPKPDDYWDIPGGRVLEGATIEETLFRELEEETGITALDFFKPLDTILSNIEIPLKDGRKVGLILTIYYCTLQSIPSIKLSAEHTEYAWVSPSEASTVLAYKYPKEFIEKIKELNYSAPSDEG